MAISFFLQSVKNPASIYVRIREGKEIDAKAKCNLSINPDHFKKGKVKLHKNISGATAKVKKEIQEKNNSLNNLQKELDGLKTYLTDLLNNRKDYETINSKWLKNALSPKEVSEVPNDLAGNFDYYLESKKNILKPSTIKKTKVFKHRIENYEKDNGTVYIQEVNRKFALKMQKWCLKNNYAHNTIVKTLKVILTVCNHAKENGIATHPELNLITKGSKYKNIDHIHLNFEELRRIKNATITNEATDIARDWLIISCYTAQRVSDFLKFSKADVKKMEGMKFLDISQEKTGKPVLIPLTEEVTTILNKRNGDFPPLFSTNIESNKTIYNKHIKEVCKLAGINEPVLAYKRDKKTNRYELKEMPKYDAVSTHIGRRSFATNYYGKINTALLINATGHASETQFLRYVGKTGNSSALSLAKEMRLLAMREGEEPKLEVVRTATN